MSTEHPEHETAHVDHAVIDVSQAEIIQSPASRQSARRLAWSLVVLFVVLLALDGVIILVNNSQVHQVRAIAAQAQRNRATVVQLCETGNEFRAQQVTLWTHLIEISTPPPHETAAQKRQRETTIRTFLRYIRQVFAPRDCKILPAARQ